MVTWTDYIRLLLVKCPSLLQTFVSLVGAEHRSLSTSLQCWQSVRNYSKLFKQQLMAEALTGQSQLVPHGRVSLPDPSSGCRLSRLSGQSVWYQLTGRVHKAFSFTQTGLPFVALLQIFS